MSYQEPDPTIADPHSCPVCQRNKPAWADLCSDCQEKFGKARDKWPDWLRYLVRAERRWIAREQRASHMELVPGYAYDIDEDGQIVVVASEDEDDDLFDTAVDPVEYAHILNTAELEDDRQYVEELRRGPHFATDADGSWGHNADVWRGARHYFGDPEEPEKLSDAWSEALTTIIDDEADTDLDPVPVPA